MAIAQMWEWDGVVEGMEVVCIVLAIDQGKMSAAKMIVRRIRDDCNVRDRRKGMFRLSVLWARLQSGGG